MADIKKFISDTDRIITKAWEDSHYVDPNDILDIEIEAYNDFSGENCITTLKELIERA